jgi:hypothetical protein
LPLRSFPPRFGYPIAICEIVDVTKTGMQAKTVKLGGRVPSAGPKGTFSSKSTPHRIFLLSPANASGRRAKLILGESAHSPLALRLRSQGVPLGEIFSSISGLYFRGKWAYARAYADPPPGIPGVLVITASGGLVSPDKSFRLEELRGIAAGDVDATNLRYRLPLERDARLLCGQMGAHCEAVLLGSIATPKYVEPLLGIFGERLMFPAEFVGRGDMSRGGLLLRRAREQVQLTYVPVAGTVCHGARPPKLPKLPLHFVRADEMSGS